MHLRWTLTSSSAWTYYYFRSDGKIDNVIHEYGKSLHNSMITIVFPVAVFSTLSLDSEMLYRRCCRVEFWLTINGEMVRKCIQLMDFVRLEYCHVKDMHAVGHSMLFVSLWLMKLSFEFPGTLSDSMLSAINQ